MKNTTKNICNGFVYKWTNIANGKWYIGSHQGNINDGYRHSSEIMAFAEKKYGVETFTREILFEGQKFRKIEAEYLNKYNAAHDPQSYNRTNITGPECYSNETIRKRSLALKGIPKSLEHRKKLSDANKGKKQTAEHRQKNSEANRGKNNPMWGRTHTEETRQKMRDAKVDYVPWNKGKTSPLIGIKHPIVTCEHCGQQGGISCMKRWHFDNCKTLVE